MFVAKPLNSWERRSAVLNTESCSYYLAAQHKTVRLCVVHLPMTFAFEFTPDEARAIAAELIAAAETLEQVAA